MQLLPFLPFLLVSSTFFIAVFCDNKLVSFYNCGQLLQWEVMVFSGAVISHNGSLGTNSSSAKCSLTVKTTPSSTFLVQLTEFSFTSNENCTEHLTLTDLGMGTKLLDAACNISTGLPAWWVTNGSELRATFVRNTSHSDRSPKSSFKIIITSIKGTCTDELFRCPLYCIAPSLVCDRIPHCPNAEDEQSCASPASALPSPPLGSSTTVQTLILTTPSEETKSMYLWLPLIVVVVFTIVMLSLVMVGRKATHCGGVTTTNTCANGENDDLRGEINSNPGFSDGRPHTPPPTYSWIERQTSYVSNISQSSSQMSIPPDYNDVVDPEDAIYIPGRRRRADSSRSSTSSASRRNWPRMFQRSMSAQETSRGRNLSDRSDPGVHRSNSVVSDTDSVFIDPPSSRPGGNISSLGNLSEVDENVGSSTIITDVAEINHEPPVQHQVGNVQPMNAIIGENVHIGNNARVNENVQINGENIYTGNDTIMNGNTPTNGNNNRQDLPDDIIAQANRPLVQRSVSDVVAAEEVIVSFSLGE